MPLLRPSPAFFPVAFTLPDTLEAHTEHWAVALLEANIIPNDRNKENNIVLAVIFICITNSNFTSKFGNNGGKWCKPGEECFLEKDGGNSERSTHPYPSYLEGNVPE